MFKIKMGEKLYKRSSNYFLVLVSTRKNLELCIKYSMAGFTNTISGLWTFLEINVGDYISFLYGGRIKNLYRVIEKVAYKNAEDLPPWQKITSGSHDYYFPFRLYLIQEREFDEPIVRPEFSYVAEDLLSLRGGYRKTHFQADTKTFYNVSEMGRPFNGEREQIRIKAETFEPKIVFNREFEKIPEKFYFKELILQSLVKNKIQRSALKEILEYFDVKESPENFEVLGEKALSEGYVDIFIKLKHPVGKNKYFLVEVKVGRAQRKHIEQLENYLGELKDELIGGILVAKDFPKSILKNTNVLLIKYNFDQIDENLEYTYEQLFNLLKLELVE